MTRHTMQLALAMAFILHSSAPAQQPGKIEPWRLAIVSVSSTERMNTLIDVTVTKLSNENGLELLERQTISRILAEQRLTLSGIVDGDRAVKTGKLLNAHAFAVIEADAVGKDALGLVIYDTETGVKWYDRTLPSGALENQVAVIEQAVRGVAKNRSAGPKAWQTVCVLGTRNADLPRSQDHVAPMIGWLLERHLLTSPSLTVLERKRLELVNREKLLTGAQRQLLSALVTLDVEISRAGNGLRATAIASDAQGKELGKVRSESLSANADDLSKGLLPGILRLLKATPAKAAPDRQRESHRFFEEGRKAASHKQWSIALPALEAASVMDPSKEEPRIELVNALFLSVFWRLRESPKDGVADTALVKELLQAGLRGYELRLLALEQSPATLEGLKSFSKSYYDTRSRLTDFRLAGLSSKALNAECRELQQLVFAAYLRMARAELARAAKLSQEPTPGTTARAPVYGAYVGRYKDFLSETQDVRFFSPQDLEAVGVEALQRWIDLSQSLGRPLGPYEVNSVLKMPLGQTLGYVGPFAALTKHPHPLVQLWGRYLLLNLRRQHGKITPADADVEYRSIKQATLETIQKSSGPPKSARAGDDLRYTCYEFLYATTKTWGFRDADARHHERFALCDFMLKRNEIVHYVLLPTVNKPQDPWTKSQFHKERWQLIEQAQSVFAAGTPALVDDPDFSRQELAQARQTILRERRDVAGPSASTSGPWKQARLLFRADRIPNIRQVALATIHGDHVYLPICRLEGGGNRDSRVDLLKMSWKEEANKEETNWKQWAHWKVPPSEAGVQDSPLFEVLASCWGDGRLYVGTQHGVFAVDEQGDVQHLSKKISFPGLKASALAFLRGKLFAALAGGYLVSLDPVTGQLETIVSSRRREASSPFDNGDVLHIRHLHADVDRNRLLLLLYQRPSVKGAYSSDRFPPQDTTNGLWEYDLKTTKFIRHLELYFDVVTTASEVRPGRLLLSTVNGDHVIEFDMKNNHSEVLFGSGWVGPSVPKVAKPPLRPDIPCYESYLEYDGYLWGANPFTFARITTKDGRAEPFPAFMTAQGRISHMVKAGVQRIADHDILVQNLTGLWRLEMQTGHRK